MEEGFSRWPEIVPTERVDSVEHANLVVGACRLFHWRLIQTFVQPRRDWTEKFFGLDLAKRLRDFVCLVFPADFLLLSLDFRIGLCLLPPFLQRHGGLLLYVYKGKKIANSEL